MEVGEVEVNEIEVSDVEGKIKVWTPTSDI